MRISTNVYFNIVATIFILPAGICTKQASVVDSGLLTQSRTLGECQACKLFVESFKNGLERTARGKYEGGDAAWEEEKLKNSYRRSEMRLVDIQEGLCKEETKHSVQCHLMANKAEDFIEEWWAQDPDESADLHTYFCIDKLQFCCPKYHYGKDCSPCLGDHANMCSGNGKCRGDGTRKGNGTCLCNEGYTGVNCDQCTVDYFQSYDEETISENIICKPCHPACMGGCRGTSHKDCVACKPGFYFEPDEGCMDINECDVKKCKKNHFCLNTLGSYMCIQCDKSCNGCYGEGPDTCRKCAEGYSKKGQFCVQDREDEQSMERMTNTRYMTYVGLLIATGILIPKSTSLGSLVGGAVLSYIVIAEYYCMINGYDGLVKLKDYDLIQLFRT